MLHIYVSYMLTLSLKSACVMRAASSNPITSFGKLVCFLKVFLIVVYSLLVEGN